MGNNSLSIRGTLDLSSDINAVVFESDSSAASSLRKEIETEPSFHCCTVANIEQLQEVFSTHSKLQYLFYLAADAGAELRAPMNSVVKFVRGNFPQVFVCRVGSAAKDGALKFQQMSLFFNWRDFSSHSESAKSDFAALKLSDKIFFEVSVVKRPKTILLVDAMQNLRDSLHELLEKTYGNAVKVIEASSGTQAINILEGLKVDLVISAFDVNSFGLSIYEYLHAKAQPPELIFFTGAANVELPPKMFLRGIIRKPDYEWLLQVVGEFLVQRQ